MSVLVLGGAGYIGSHAVYRLIEEGKDVVVIDKLYTQKPFFMKAISVTSPFYVKYSKKNRLMLSSISLPIHLSVNPWRNHSCISTIMFTVHKYYYKP